MRENEERQLEEAWQHIQPYIGQEAELKEMCTHCENYCRDKHDYDDCRNQMCFKFYLAHVYLSWCNAYGG